MHRRPLTLLHVGLALAVLLLAWRLVAAWERVNQLRYGTVPQARSSASAPLATTFPEPPATPTGEIVAKNLFTSDRTNAVLQPETLRPAPPVPIVFGTMNLGGSYEALMAEGGPSAARHFRRIKNGEPLGAYTVVEIRDDKVVIEYQGQKTTIDVYQSANSVPRLEVRTTPATAPVVETGGSAPPPTAASQQTASPPVSSGATAPSGPEVRVTIEGNRRRFERQTLFGPQVWYEDIRK